MNSTTATMNAAKRSSRRRARRRGAALVEAALVLPAVLLFIMGLFEYGRYFLMVHVCNNAVSAAAAYACKHTSPIVLSSTTYGNATTDVQNIVTANMGTQQLANSSVSVYLSDSSGNAIADSTGANPGSFTYASAGNYVTVKLTGTYTFIPTTLLGLSSTSSKTFMSVRRSEGN